MALRRLAVILVPLAVFLAVACGGGEEEASPTATATPSEVSPAATGTVVVATPVGTFTPGPTVTSGEAIPMGKIAFKTERDGNNEIYVTTTVLGEVNITNNPAEERDPDWSPDGTKILFASDREGKFDIYVADPDGSNVTRLTGEQAGDLTPKWSPDGKRIAFSRNGAIMVMNSDGTDVKQVTQPEPESTAAPCKAGGFLGGWSPDGEHISFYAASATRGIGQVCTVKVDGSDLTVVKSDPDTYHVEPVWSPTGDWIVYRSIREGNHEIYKIRPDGSDDTNLTNSPATDIEPDWSPDGNWIVFSSNRYGPFNMFVMRADGSDLMQITSNPAKDSDPSWGVE